MIKSGEHREFGRRRRRPEKRQSGLKTDFTRRFQPAKCVTRPLGEMRASCIYIQFCDVMRRDQDALGEIPSTATVCVIRQYNYVRSRRGAKLSSFKKGAQKEPMVPRTDTSAF